MKLKPRSTMRNVRGLVYKRYTQIETGVVARQLFYTIQDKRYWAFDNSTLSFIEIKEPNIMGVVVISVPNDNGYTKYQYGKNAFNYTTQTGWVKHDITSNGLESIIATNTGKYQINKYYYFGSLDYSIKGSITGSTTQYIKGNIVPTISMNIKHYNDYVDLQVDDLIVVDKKLYVVESTDTDHKHQPKDYCIYTATLNNIL